MPFPVHFPVTFSPLPSLALKSIVISLPDIFDRTLHFLNFSLVRSRLAFFTPRHPRPRANGTGSRPLTTPLASMVRGHPG